MAALSMRIKRSGHHIRPLIAYTISHMCMDFICFFILCRGFEAAAVSEWSVSTGFLVYNIVSYGLQPFIGYYSDKHPRFFSGIIGCVLAALALPLMSFPWLSLLLAAIGSAFFHVGGGVDVLRHAEGRMWRAGIFVSTGAFGGGLGILAAAAGSFSIFEALLISAVTIVLIAIWGQPRHMTDPCEFVAYADIPFIPVLIFTPLSVILRAFVGGAVPMLWRDTTFLFLLPYIAGGIGKVAGGFLGDSLGAKNVSVCSLLLSVPFLCIGDTSPLFSSIGLILFNMITPITLSAIVTKLPNNPGLAFGIVRVSTIIGTVLTYFIKIPGEQLVATIAVVTMIAAACTALSPSRTLKISEGAEKIADEEFTEEPEKIDETSDHITF